MINTKIHLKISFIYLTKVREKLINLKQDSIQVYIVFMFFLRISIEQDNKSNNKYKKKIKNIRRKLSKK